MDFKAYFQGELTYLKELVPEFAEQYPLLPLFLSLHTGEPKVQLLFENVTFLTANARKNVEDAICGLIHRLFNRVFPLPAATLIQFYSISAEMVGRKKEEGGFRFHR